MEDTVRDQLADDEEDILASTVDTVTFEESLRLTPGTTGRSVIRSEGGGRKRQLVHGPVHGEGGSPCGRGANRGLPGEVEIGTDRATRLGDNR